MSQQLSRRGSVEADKREQKLEMNGSYSKSSVTFYKGRIHLADGRTTPLTNNNLMCNVEAAQKSALYGASGEYDKQDKLRIYGAAFWEAYEGYSKLAKLAEENPFISINQLKLMGAAGEEAITGFEAVRKNAALLGVVSGQQRVEEDLNAINIAEQINTTDLKVEFARKTSAVNSADIELADDQMPSDIRGVFAVGTHELFADGTSYNTSLRDKELKVDVVAEIQKEIPLMFVQAKEDKVVALVNALNGNNLGDWTATTGNFYDVRAAQDVQTAEDVVKVYGGTRVVLIADLAWRSYEDNLGSAFDGKAGNLSTNTPNPKTGTLKGNPSVTYFINASITADSFVMASKENYMKYIQGMVINTTFTDERTSGQTQWTFHFDFNGFFENETGASYRATTLSS